MADPRQPDTARLPAEGLRRFFARLVRPSFAALGLDTGPVADYVTDLLARFARTEQLYRVRDGQGRPLETVADMLLELARLWGPGRDYQYDREIDLRRHCGDFALFMSGLFRARVERDALLGYYLAEGQRSYRTVADRLGMVYASGAALFRDLAHDFEHVSGALDYMRKVHMQPGSYSGPEAAALRVLGLN